MDDETLTNVLARLEQLERENKLLKQWAARLKERLDKPPEPEPAKAIGGMSRGQRALIWVMVVALVFLGLKVMMIHSQFDSMSAWISTKELHIVDEDGNVGIVLANMKEHGPRLFMNDKINLKRMSFTGATKIAMAVTKDGRPSLMFFRAADKAQPFDPKPGPPGIHIGISEGEHPKVYLNGPVGENGIFLGTDPTPSVRVFGEDGKNLIRLP